MSKKNILGLISKMPVYNGFPETFEKAKSAYVWSNGKKYLDMSYNGLGTNLLGYANKRVNKAVKKAINNGNSSTLNCFEEEILAEQLVRIHPQFSNVRYARTGGEAVAIALKLAQQCTEKKGIMQCGYSGWHLEGLHTKKFEFNNINSFYNNFDSSIGIIIMEVIRNQYPNIAFFKAIKRQCELNNIILIFDEITSGFRFDIGGYFENLKYVSDQSLEKTKIMEDVIITPDICVFAKAVSNGYPMGIVMMTKDVAEKNKNTFISSTYFTERIGSVSALATISELCRMNYKYLYELGKQVQKIWMDCSKKYGIEIEINDVPQLAHFDFVSEKRLEYRTIFVYIMLEYGILGNNSFYPTFSHKWRHIKEYAKICDLAFDYIETWKKEPETFIENQGLKVIQDRPVIIK